MDLNTLLFQHQVAILRACALGRDTASHFDLVHHYKRRIDRLRQSLGVTAYPDWCAMPPYDAS